MAVELTVASAIHLAAVVPAAVIGAVQLAAPKGTRPHRLLGWVWVLAMLTAALSSFWVMEIRKGAGWSVIHLLSAWVLVALALAIWHIRRGNVRAHKAYMVGTLLGLAGAGIGALLPGRFLAQLFL
ncbi:MAG: DUF2306 domain-containing protein [Burkholderiales bacterium]